jgi:gamma-glutamylcyclotransferase (GGCT)/AIG2-like uncharacterized protein YtfP
MEQPSQPRLYFAYGSNINLEHMRKKCSNPLVLGIARLPGHKIGFYGYSVTWDGAVETVIPDTQSEVWGLLYQLKTFDWERLDSCEDAKADGTGEYFHYPVQVLDKQQTIKEASIYKKARLGQAEQPSAEYVSIMIQGAKEQGLPEDYIAALQKIGTKPASYQVPRRPSYDRVGVAGEGCNGCSD